MPQWPEPRRRDQSRAVATSCLFGLFSPLSVAFAFFKAFFVSSFSNWWRENIFCFSFLGSDKMINGTNIGPDRAFWGQTKYQNKARTKFFFFFWMHIVAIFVIWSILLSRKSQICFSKFQITSRDKSSRINLVLVTISREV